MTDAGPVGERHMHARTETAGKMTDVLGQHAAGSGIAYFWELQLLNTPVPNAAG